MVLNFDFFLVNYFKNVENILNSLYEMEYLNGKYLLK